MDTHVIAHIIGWSTAVITVGGIIWMGVRIARRNTQFKQKIEYLPDGFLYHGPMSDIKIKWKDITAARIELFTPIRWKGRSGTSFHILSIDARKKSFFIAPEDFEHSNFDEFISALEKNVRIFNPRFKGIEGDPELIRKEIPQPYIPTREEIEEDRKADEVTLRVEERIAALGRPVSQKERRKIVMEELKK